MRSAFVDLASQPQRNLHWNPGAGTPSVGNGTLFGAWAGTAPNASTISLGPASWSASGAAYRQTWTARTVAAGDIGLSLGFGTSPIPQIAGRRATFVFDAVFSVGGWSAGTVAVGNLSSTSGTSTTRTVATSPGQAVTAGVPIRCWATADIQSDITIIGSVRVGLNSLPLAAGVWAEVSNADIYLGDYNPNRMPGNGDLPGWRWTGTAWASESVGYPYTLESIVGKPLFDVQTPGTTVNLNPADYNPAANGIAILSVSDLIAIPAVNATSTVVTYGTSGGDTTPPSNVAGRYIGGTATDGSTQVNWQTRTTGGVGPNVKVAVAPGRYVTLTGVVPGGNLLIGASAPLSGGLLVDNRAAGASTAITHTVLSVAANTSFHSTLRVVGFPATDAATITRAMAWLARRYGAAIPSGY